MNWECITKMDDDCISQVAILVFVLLLSAYFSATEAAFQRFNKSRMRNLAANNKKAELVLKLEDDYDNLMSTIIILRSILNVTAASLFILIFVSISILGESIKKRRLKLEHEYNDEDDNL